MGARNRKEVEGQPMTENERPQELVPGSGHRVEPRALQQMVSVRLDGALVAELRAHAREAGMSLSDLLREAVTRYLGEFAERQAVTVHWTVTNGTRTNAPTSREFDTVAVAS
jgi:hypothetical protein